MGKLARLGPGSAKGSVKALKYPDPLPDLSEHTCIVTGGNGGVGYEIAAWLAQRGARVILACRSAQRGEDALNRLKEAAPDAKDRLELWLLDLSSLRSVRDFVKKWESQANGGRLDLLVNNAGTVWIEKKFSEDGFEMTYQANQLSHFLLTLLLLPYLQRAPHPRVVAISSGSAYDDKIDFSKGLNGEEFPDQWYMPLALWRGYKLYCRAKLLQVMFTVELQRRLSANPSLSYIRVQACHPGFVATGLGSQSHLLPSKWSLLSPTFYASKIYQAITPFIARTPTQGAMTPIWAAASEEAGEEANGGKMWIDCQQVVLPDQAEDAEACRKAWDIQLRDSGLEQDTLGALL